MFYQPNNDHDLELKETLDKKESFLENIEYNNILEIQESDNQILTPLQIENFQKIFAQYTIKESDDEQETDEKMTVFLDQQEKEAFFVKLCTLVCCKTRMCLTKIDHEFAFQIFDSIRKLSKTEHNIIKPIVHALAGRKSNRALPFAAILNVLTFIGNYSNCYGLPSP
ncbi:20455_t:CDS:2, partial [Dentiscutata erythropus]